MRTVKQNETQFENENWRIIKEAPNYEISDFGRLRHTFKNGKTKLVKPSENTTNKGKRDYQFYIIENKKYYVHFLVLTTFVGTKPIGWECDHINGDKHDNTLQNLRYLTRSENRSHKGSQHPNSKLNDEKVRQLRSLWQLKKSLDLNQQKLADLFGVTPSAISSAITRKSWSHID
ncbi:HNH endonuclease [Flavobacterium enshiense]|uniref:HNH endonuclease n=1 Tax=Flavobacterium enshiense TaxID=1341165 RepID=UPI00345DEE98